MWGGQGEVSQQLCSLGVWGLLLCSLVWAVAVFSWCVGSVAVFSWCGFASQWRIQDFNMGVARETYLRDISDNSSRGGGFACTLIYVRLIYLLTEAAISMQVNTLFSWRRSRVIM